MINNDKKAQARWDDIAARFDVQQRGVPVDMENLAKAQHNLAKAEPRLDMEEHRNEKEFVNEFHNEAVQAEPPVIEPWEMYGGIDEIVLKRTEPNIRERQQGNKVKHLANIHPDKWCKGDVGVEIEVEGRRLPTGVQRYWEFTQDGSLNHDIGLEYVLKKPQSMGFVRCALKHFDYECKRMNTTLHDSIRAGVHIHINIQDLTKTELFNFIVLFLVWEEALVRYCGSNREGNLFCLRTRDAQYLLHSLMDIAANGTLTNFYDDDFRYAAMNVKAIIEHGSLEFRSMRSTRDTKAIGDFAEMLLNLREKAKTYRDPRDIVNNFSGVTPDEFARECFGSQAHHLLTQHDLDETTMRGVRFAQDVAYAYKE